MFPARAAGLPSSNAVSAERVHVQQPGRGQQRLPGHRHRVRAIRRTLQQALPSQTPQRRHHLQLATWIPRRPTHIVIVHHDHPSSSSLPGANHNHPPIIANAPGHGHAQNR